MVDPGTRAGVLYTGGAFFIWGMVPLYFSLLRPVSAFEILAHRVLWSVVFIMALLLFPLARPAGPGTGFAPLRALVAQPGTVARLALTSALVATNWLTFVWAVNVGRVLETSLGYFITPQVNVVLGFLFLGERLRVGQWLAVGLATAGVMNQVWLLGQLPWISLTLAATFGCYGLFRKQIAVDPITGLLTETLLASPVAVAYLGYRWQAGTLHFGAGARLTDVLLVLLGVVTAVPLILFAAGAQRLRLVTVGFLQYLAPSMSFLLALFVFGEPLGKGQLLTFLFIWAGIIVYTVDSTRRGPARPVPLPAPGLSNVPPSNRPASGGRP